MSCDLYIMGDQCCEETDGVNGNKEPEGGETVEETEDLEEKYAEEYSQLDSTLDQLDSCLDALESKNDDLCGRLQALLDDSRQARLELESVRINPKQQTKEATQEDTNSAGDQTTASEEMENLTIAEETIETVKPSGTNQDSLEQGSSQNAE